MKLWKELETITERYETYVINFSHPKMMVCDIYFFIIVVATAHRSDFFASPVMLIDSTKYVM